jgi:hypothetical protein
MYLTYDEASDAPFNVTLDEDAYALLEYRARKTIDLATHGRIADETDVREAVKYCVYELVKLYDSLQASVDAASGGVVSMSNDGVSVSYGSVGGLTPAAAMQQRENGILKQYLSLELTESGVPILYAGVDA